MTLFIQILLSILLIVGIFAVGRLYVILGEVRQSLGKMEETRTEISSTMKRLEIVATSTEEILRTEVTPTLQVTRATLANLEVTTRALADTTLAVRGLTGRAEQVVGAQRLLTAAVPIARMVGARGGGFASSLLAGIGTGIKAVLGRKKRTPPPNPELEPKARPRVITDGNAVKRIPPADSASESRR